MDFVPIKDYSGTQLPPFTMATILHYFVTRIACDGKSTNDLKNLEKKSYPLFFDGHVQNITVSSGDKSTYNLSGKLLARNEEERHLQHSSHPEHTLW